MVEVNYPQQLQQWTLEKSLHYAERSDSAVTTPDLDDHDAVDFKPDSDKLARLTCHESLFQDRYLSSEEDLSPTDLEPDESISMDDDFSVTEPPSPPQQPDDLEPELHEPPKTCDLAVVVSYVAAGRPKVIDLPLPTPHRERPLRSTSLVHLPLSQSVPTRPSRLSLVCTATTLPLAIPESPRPSTARACSAPIEPVSKPRAASRASLASLPHPPPTARSSTSSTSSAGSPRRPHSSRITSIQWTQPFRSSFAALHSPKVAPPPAYAAPPTPVTPVTPSFLDSDPFANVSPGSGAAGSTSLPKHRRLRSISRTLSLAKIAVQGHGHKKDKAKDHDGHAAAGRKDSTISISSPLGVVPRDQPLTPQTPVAPVTPLLSPGIAAAMAAGRRFSQPRMLPRPNDRLPPPDAIGEEIPPRPLRSSRMRMVPRGAGEREPLIELPPFPAEDRVPSIPSVSSRASSPQPDRPGTWDKETKRKVRKRKSLLGLV